VDGTTTRTRFDRRDTAVDLVQRCLRALEASEARGGPSVDQHVDDLRRALARRRVTHAGARSRQVAAALRSGGDVGVAGPLLLHDLRGVERALTHTLRVGALTTAT
jgi:hypothetical protein